jgi:hypothetical protein
MLGYLIVRENADLDAYFLESPPRGISAQAPALTVTCGLELCMP